MEKSYGSGMWLIDIHKKWDPKILYKKKKTDKWGLDNQCLNVLHVVLQLLILYFEYEGRQV